MTRGPHHSRLGAVMWGAIGITLMAMAVVAIYELDPRVAGYAVGALVVVCLAVCGAAFWLDTRTSRAILRRGEQLKPPSGRRGP